jgi:hypothetical protein
VFVNINYSFFTTDHFQKNDNNTESFQVPAVEESRNSNFEYTVLDLNSAPNQITNVTDQDVVYAIICPSNLTNVVEPLAAWKTQKGVPAKIYTTDGPEGIYASFPDGDNATKIHDFLTILHENNSNLEWVLLVGDEDIIPSRQVFVNASDPFGLDDFYYSDQYYAGLNNSWDQDNDGIYGEQKGDVGWHADLYVGRLPVNNASEAKLAVDKIIQYETSPTVGNWMRNATFWSGLLDGPNNASAYDSYKDNAIKVTNKILPMVPEHMNINHLYDYNELEGGNYSTEGDTLYHLSGKSSFYSGHSFISFAGQAYYTGDELAHYFEPTGQASAPDGFGPLFSYNDAKYSTNGAKLPFLYLSTCSVNFAETDDSNLEVLLTAKNGGVIGLIANSGKTYRGETEDGSSYGNWWLKEHFWEMFFNGTAQPGKILYELKIRYNMEVIYTGVPYIEMAVANLVGYNYLGDPELSIWTDTPKTLKFESSIHFDETHKLLVQITNQSGSPVNNARVCVFNTEEYAYAVTNSTGHALLALDPRLTSELNATITAHNYLPLTGQFSYENQPPKLLPIPDLVLEEDTELLEVVNLTNFIFDPDNTINQLDIEISEVTAPEANVWVDISNKINVRPSVNWYGEAEVTILVFDGIAYVWDSFTVTVLPVNDAPLVNLMSDQTVNAGETFKYQINAFDIENDKLSYSDDSKMFEIDPDSGYIKFKAENDDVGKHLITITVSDGTNSSNVNFTLVVEKSDEVDFWSIYWFPVVVIIGTITVIGIILGMSSTEEEETDKKKDNDKAKGKSKAKKVNRKKSKK